MGDEGVKENQVANGGKEATMKTTVVAKKASLGVHRQDGGDDLGEEKE